MNTFLLLWNPAISRYTINRCEEEFNFEDGIFDFIDDEDNFPWDLNWSVWEWEKAREGGQILYAESW